MNNQEEYKRYVREISPGNSKNLDGIELSQEEFAKLIDIICLAMSDIEEENGAQTINYCKKRS